MQQEMTFDNIEFMPDGGVIVYYTWNGVSSSKPFANMAELVAQNAQLFTTGEEALRFLLYYLLALGNGQGENLSQFIGKKLTQATNVAVDQVISLQ